MAARRNRKRRRRNRGRFGALYKLLSILLIFAAILAGCIIFFRVNTMVVTGNSRYTQEEILAAAGVEKGDNLFTLNKYQIADRILTQLPYVDDVAISRKLPDTLIFEVSESAGVAWVESGGSYWLLDDKCKLLEVGDAALVQGKPQVLGLDPVNPSVGNLLTVSAEQQDKLEQLQAFLKAIRERLMTGSLKGFIDLTSANEIRFGYGENLTVIFPMNGDFTQETYELKLALETMDERGLPRTGTLDQNYEDNKIHLLPERWLPIVPYFRILCLSGLFAPLSVVSYNILKIKSDGKLIFRLEMVKKLLATVVLAVTIPISVKAIAWGQTVIYLSDALLNLLGAGRYLHWTVWQRARATSPYLALSVLMLAAVWGVRTLLLGHVALWVVLIAEIVAGGAVYVGLAMLFRPEGWREVRLILAQGLAERFRR